jgi:hypothetical protein
MGTAARVTVFGGLGTPERVTELNAKSIDNLVLGTVNAPWKRTLNARTLASLVRRGDVDAWLPHVATFFTEVRPHLIIGFAQAHRIPRHSLVESYEKVRRATGESNEQLEQAFEGLGTAA